jgi:hypothetical protein
MLGFYYGGQAYTGQSGFATTVFLSVQNATHAHTAASPTLNELSTLAVANASHAITTGTPTLVQQHILAAADTLHGHIAESPTVQRIFNLAVDNALHTHIAESVSLTIPGLVVGDTGNIGLTSDNVALLQAHILAVADASHAVNSDNSSVVVTLLPHDATHSVASTVVQLVEQHNLAVQNALHGHIAGSPAMDQQQFLAVANAIHAHAAGNVDILITRTQNDWQTKPHAYIQLRKPSSLSIAKTTPSGLATEKPARITLRRKAAPTGFVKADRVRMR